MSRCDWKPVGKGREFPNKRKRIERITLKFQIGKRIFIGKTWKLKLKLRLTK